MKDVLMLLTLNLVSLACVVSACWLANMGQRWTWPCFLVAAFFCRYSATQKDDQ